MAAVYQSRYFQCTCPEGTRHVEIDSSFGALIAHDVNTLWHVIQEADPSLRIIHFEPIRESHDFGRHVGIINAVVGYRCELANSSTYLNQQMEKIIQRVDAMDKPFYQLSNVSISRLENGNYAVLFAKVTDMKTLLEREHTAQCDLFRRRGQQQEAKELEQLLK